MGFGIRAKFTKDFTLAAELIYVKCQLPFRVPDFSGQ
jgi:hypothetical protein